MPNHARSASDPPPESPYDADRVGSDDARLVPRSPLILALVVFAVCMALVFAVAERLWATSEARELEATRHEARLVAEELKDRFESLAHLLTGAAAFVRSSDRVSTSDWQSYLHIALSQVAARSVVQGVAFIQQVDKDQLAAFESMPDRPAGHPVRVFPAGERSRYFPIRFIQPATPENNRVLGFDLYTEPVRRAAVDAALRSGLPTLSGPLVLKTELGERRVAAVMLLRVPDRPEGRGPDQLRGFTLVGFRYADLILGIADRHAATLGISVSDVGAAGQMQTIFEETRGWPVAPGLGRSVTAGGRTFALAFHPAPSQAALTDARVAFAVGTLLSLLLALLSYKLRVAEACASERARHATTDLAASERRFALAMEAASEGVWEWRVGGASVFLSAQCSALLEPRVANDREGLRSLLRLLGQADRRALLASIRALVRDSVPCEVEIGFDAGPRGARCLRVRASADRMPDGSMLGIAGSLSDVTDLREGERRLRRTESFLSHLVDVVPDAILVTDADCRVVMLNQVAERLFGLEHAAATGRTLSEILGDSFGTRMEREDRWVLAHRSATAREDVFDGRPPRQVHLMVRKVPILDVSDRPAVVTVLNDITSLRNAELELRASLEEFDALFRNASLGFVLVDQAGLIRKCNSAFEGIIKRAEEELLLLDFRKLLPATEDEVFEPMWEQAFTQGRFGPLEARCRRFDGEVVAVRIAGARVSQLGGVGGVWCIVEDISREHAADRALAAANAANRTILAALPDVLVQVDECGRFVHVHAADPSELTVDTEHFLGRTIEEVLPPQRAEAYRASIARAVAGGGPQIVEYAARDQRGEIQDYEARTTPVRSGGVITIVRRITDRKRAERALRESELRWQFALEGAGDGVWDWSLPAREVVRSARWYATLGYETDTQRGQSRRDWLAMVHPDDLASTRDRVAAIETGKTDSYVNEYRLRAADGSWRWVLSRGKAVSFDQNGAVTRVIGTTTDISERKRAEAALRESEARFRRMADSAPVLIWVSDEHGERSYLNRTWCKFVGASLASLLGSGWQQHIHPDDRAAYVSACKAAIASGQDFSAELRLLRSDGSYRWLLDTGLVARDADGQLKGFIGSCVDVTVLKMAEGELRRHGERLSELVEEQTRDLRHAKEVAEAASQAKSMFLANMSHELRTPLHAILSYAQLGENRAGGVPPERLKDYFGRVKRSGARLLELLNDLLDLSKLEAGRMTMYLDDCNLRNVIDEAVHEFDGLAHVKRLAVGVSSPPDGVVARVDAKRIGQVVRNLLSNAIKFTPEHGRIEISLTECRIPAGRRTTDSGATPGVRLVVSDSGVGIPAAELEKIFDKFVQSTATASGAGGTGLGLSICAEIVNAHKGRIHAECNAGGGADFIVELPLAADTQGGPRPRTAEPAEWGCL
ncbi:MAG: PAS domain S-box protein [Rhodocyclaceae bacterium]|nr:PAS domain S-box protein [Rhodocyclaceae bacterium]